MENVVTLKVYDLGQPAPRFPVTRFFTLSGLIANALPSEVAVCCSYVAERNQPKHRGRIYLGPLGQNSVLGTNGRAQVADNFAQSIVRSYMRLQGKNARTLKLWSPTDIAMREITGVWVDNAFDTMRKRGEAETERWTMGSFLGQKGTILT